MGWVSSTYIKFLIGNFSLKGSVLMPESHYVIVFLSYVEKG
jgi:hypothetical protein